jgi:Tat protein secretion system quality control protein TatD with DNase activity
VNVGDLVMHIYTGRIYLVRKAWSDGYSVSLVGWPPNQVFSAVTDLALVRAA